MPPCINLKERFGRKFKVIYEESYYAQYGPRARVDDPWLQIIPGRRGHVYPWDLARLAATSKTSGPTAKRLPELAGAEVYVDASDGATILFPVDLLDQVADILLLRRRRRMSEKERQRLAGIGFKPRSSAYTGVRPASAVCVPTPQVDAQDLPQQGACSERRNPPK